MKKLLFTGILYAYADQPKCSQKYHLDLYNGYEPGVIDPDYRLHCHTDVECCSQAEVSQLTTNLARNIRDQLRQQAENIQFTKADILEKFEAELQDAQTKTEDQLKKSFQNSEIFRKIQNSEIVNNFFENLGSIFENSHSSILEIFDEFCEDATVGYVEEIYDGELEEECIRELFRNTKNQPDHIVNFRDRLQKGFNSKSHIMWILEEIVSLLGSYSVEDLLPTAKCVAPTLFCGPCTDTKINIDQRTCTNMFEQSGNSCLHWLDGWENIIKLLEDAVEEHLQRSSSYDLIFERIFEQIPSGMVKSVQELLTKRGPEIIKEIDSNGKCRFQPSRRNHHQKKLHKRNHSKKLDSRRITTRQVRPFQFFKFSTILASVPEKSRELKRIVVDTICCKISINDEMMICDPTESGCSTYSQNEINMDRHDLTIQSELENRIDKIERKIRKRSIDQSESSNSFEKKTSKKEISIHFTSDEISNDEMSGDYGDELSDDEDDLTIPELPDDDMDEKKFRTSIEKTENKLVEVSSTSRTNVTNIILLISFLLLFL